MQHQQPLRFEKVVARRGLGTLLVVVLTVLFVWSGASFWQGNPAMALFMWALAFFFGSTILTVRVVLAEEALLVSSVWLKQATARYEDIETIRLAPRAGIVFPLGWTIEAGTNGGTVPFPGMFFYRQRFLFRILVERARQANPSVRVEDYVLRLTGLATNGR